jgi:hypothetical protein
MRSRPKPPPAWARGLGAAGLAGLLLLGGRAFWAPLPQWSATSEGPSTSFGVMHVHTALSHDSRSKVEDIAAAAAAQQLNFIVFTDHNARQRLLPAQLHGVNLLAFAELSTPCGHVIAFDDPQPITAGQRHAPQILNLLRARGTAALLAHPSDKRQPWKRTGPCQADGAASGQEIANVAASLRRLPKWRLLPTVLTGLVSAPWAIAQLYDRDDEALALWDAHPAADYVGVCGLDAHGWLPHRLELLPWELGLHEPAASVTRSIRRGALFCSAGLLGRPRFEFFAKLQGGGLAGAGDQVAASRVDRLVVDGSPLTGADQWIRLLRDGQLVHCSESTRLELPHPGPGTYRVEVWARLPGLLWGSRAVPVIYSNRLELRP